MQDPVSGFEYPASWIKNCNNPESLAIVESGHAILTANGDIRKRGFTTGTTAAAAAKAAVLSLSGRGVREVSILTPVYIRISIPVITESGVGRCFKYSGDYPGDVTAGLEFIAHALQVPGNEVRISTGPGIGIWTRDTPRYRKGEPAISIQAMEEIRNAISEALSETGLSGVSVTIQVYHGAEVAEKTLNRVVGVGGGISVLGTTGFVEPWDDHLEQTICERALGKDHVVLTTGRIGLRYARILFPDYEVILAGSRLGNVIPHLTGKITICGLPALVLKYLNPKFLENTGFLTVEEMVSSEHFIPAMQSAFAMYKTEYPDIRIVIVNREGKILGDSG